MFILPFIFSLSAFNRKAAAEIFSNQIREFPYSIVGNYPALESVPFATQLASAPGLMTIQSYSAPQTKGGNLHYFNFIIPESVEVDGKTCKFLSMNPSFAVNGKIDPITKGVEGTSTPGSYEVLLVKEEGAHPILDKYWVGEIGSGMPHPQYISSDGSIFSALVWAKANTPHVQTMNIGSWPSDKTLQSKYQDQTVNLSWLYIKQLDNSDVAAAASLPLTLGEISHVGARGTYQMDLNAKAEACLLEKVKNAPPVAASLLAIDAMYTDRIYNADIFINNIQAFIKAGYVAPEIFDLLIVRNMLQVMGDERDIHHGPSWANSILRNVAPVRSWSLKRAVFGVIHDAPLAKLSIDVSTLRTLAQQVIDADNGTAWLNYFESPEADPGVRLGFKFSIARDRADVGNAIAYWFQNNTHLGQRHTVSKSLPLDAQLKEWLEVSANSAP